jgi:hypothetical protein
MLASMARWLRLAGLVVTLAIGDSCGLKAPAVPHLEVDSAAHGAVAPGPAASRDAGLAERRLPPVATGVLASAASQAAVTGGRIAAAMISASLAGE